MPPPCSFIRPFALFSLITLALISLSWPPAPWAAWRPATCMPDACFCEAIGTGFVRQPIATWSNLAFVLAGVLILEDVKHPVQRAAAPRVRRERSHVCVSESKDTTAIRQRPAYGIIYAFAAILIGLGSWFYHASLTFIGQWFDVMGMYLLGTFMVLYNVARLRPLSNRAFVVSYVLFNLALGISLIVVPEVRRYLFGGLLVVTIALEVLIRLGSRGLIKSPRIRLRPAGAGKPRLQFGYFIAALLVYVLAQIIWTLDLNHIGCDPHGLLQGHVVWHGLTAISAGLLYLYYRSEA